MDGLRRKSSRLRDKPPPTASESGEQRSEEDESDEEDELIEYDDTVRRLPFLALPRPFRQRLVPLLVVLQSLGETLPLPCCCSAKDCDVFACGAAVGGRETLPFCAFRGRSAND